jgi:hypothetical protein
VIEAGLVRAPLRISAKYKTTAFAAVVKADATIELNGSTYPSLSAAGSAALASVGAVQKDGDLRAVNGWDFWCYQPSDGKARPLAHARHEFVVATQNRRPQGGTG